MNLLILDENFATVEAITIFQSLLWSAKWDAPGTFELVAPDSYGELAASVGNPLKTRYIFRADSIYVGRVDNVVYEDGLIVASGKFLEGLLTFRYENTHNRVYSGNVETVARNIVNNNCIASKPIKYLKLGVNGNKGANITAALFGKNIGVYLYDDIAGVHENSYNIRYDRLSQSLIFQVIWGADRTQAQTINDWCLFGRQWGNVYSEKFETNTDYPNYAIVWGEGEDENRVSVIVDIRKPGEELREISVDARDLRQEGLTLAEYQSVLRNRGLKKLSEQGKFENICADVNVSPNMPYDLGDLVSVKHEKTGLVFYLRINEVKEIFDGGKIEKKISFGVRQGGVMQAIINTNSN